jgi:O-antigen/teichoic acid export membrane protein
VPDDDQETADERRNRELIELLNELRVALPGVQVLFAFLLTIPFSRGFPKLTKLDRDVYFVALIATMVSTVLLITPSSYHRFVFRLHDKEQLLETSNRLIIAGLAVLAVAMTCSLFLISDFLFGWVVTGVVTAFTAFLFAFFWYAIPIRRRRRGRTQPNG